MLYPNSNMDKCVMNGRDQVQSKSYSHYFYFNQGDNWSWSASILYPIHPYTLIPTKIEKDLTKKISKIKKSQIYLNDAVFLTVFESTIWYVLNTLIISCNKVINITIEQIIKTDHQPIEILTAIMSIPTT